jgi:hypothetical protein
MKGNRITRRQFLKAALAGVTGLAIAVKGRKLPGMAQSTPPPIHLPILMKGSGAVNLRGRVIHLIAPAVTNWDFNSSHYYGRTQATGVVGVSQPVVDTMVDRGVTALLSLQSADVAEAWRRLTPDYVAGDIIAIKINLNNSFNCSSAVASIDAIAQPVNAVVRGLKLRGVRDQDILIYDAIRSVPTRLYNELANHNILIYDDSGCRGHTASFASSDLNASVVFHPPSGTVQIVRINDMLIQSKYLINMPIMKGHPIAGVTLGFKNHFGSTNNPSGMHAYVDTDYAQINQYDALVDLNANPHIRDKTVLVLGDGIYGSRQYQDTPPERWSTFGNASPCSLFFATDPVAIDCVMHDLLKAERGAAQPATSNAYLRLAENAGMGIYEAGNPWQTPYGSGYTNLSYLRYEM